ncbi:MAG: glycosyltransferase family 2 protein [Verrucomicrobia subdivision 3 bacterium]|nr:glycosyltransferase family 2 protein [Limisphaerales bacterium]
MAAPKISLIISTYDRPGALSKVMLGVARQVAAPCEVILADDGSGELTRAVVEKLADQLSAPFRHFWHEDSGFRKTKILNRAIAGARGDYIVLLDGDCVPHRRFIADHSQLAERGWWVQGRRSFIREQFSPSFQPSRTGFFNWWLRGRASGLFKGVRWPMPFIRHDQAQRGIIGCNMGVWREDLFKVNGFDESFEGWGLEDSDLGNRLYHLGRHRKLVYGRAIIHHLNHPELPREDLPANHDRLMTTLKERRVKCANGLDLHLNGD